MCVCMYVCVYTCIYMHMHIYMHTYIYIYIHTHTYIYIYTHTHIYTHTYIGWSCTCDICVMFQTGGGGFLQKNDGRRVFDFWKRSYRARSWNLDSGLA